MTHDSDHYEEQMASLSEETLTKDVIIPLLKALNYRNVRYVHGRLEHGVDILCSQDTPLGAELCGIQVKAVAVTGSKTAPAGNVSEIVRQADAALRHAFMDDLDNATKPLDKFIIITSRKITDTARMEIRDAISSFGRTLKFIDGQGVADLVAEHMATYVQEYFARRALMVELAHMLRSPLQGIESDLEWLQEIIGRNGREGDATAACNRAQSQLHFIGRILRNYMWTTAPPNAFGLTLQDWSVQHILDLKQANRGGRVGPRRAGARGADQIPWPAVA